MTPREKAKKLASSYYSVVYLQKAFIEGYLAGEGVYKVKAKPQVKRFPDALEALDKYRNRRKK